MLLAQDKQPKKITSFNLYVNVKNFVCRIGENADILLTLYDAKEGQFFRFCGHVLFGITLRLRVPYPAKESERGSHLSFLGIEQ